MNRVRKVYILYVVVSNKIFFYCSLSSHSSKEKCSMMRPCHPFFADLVIHLTVLCCLSQVRCRPLKYHDFFFFKYHDTSYCYMSWGHAPRKMLQSFVIFVQDPENTQAPSCLVVNSYYFHNLLLEWILIFFLLQLDWQLADSTLVIRWSIQHMSSLVDRLISECFEPSSALKVLFLIFLRTVLQ